MTVACNRNCTFVYCAFRCGETYCIYEEPDVDLANVFIAADKPGKESAADREALGLDGPIAKKKSGTIHDTSSFQGQVEVQLYNLSTFNPNSPVY